MSSEQPVFFYDLGSPACYLMAEQIMSTLPAPPEWEPVLASELSDLASDPSRRPDARPPSWTDIAHAAARLGLQELRPPALWPPDSRKAMLAATYAKHIGRAVAFSLAAFRQVFAAGRELGDLDTVLIAAAACEMHPAALTRALALRSVSDGLRGAAERARLAGVQRLPAVQLAGRVYQGEDALCEASAAVLERERA